ncbi:S1C family serine protease [Arvimicrobium flavum]|uniref:S1C family serine protease n=1 Tax=Arvimicrobium flavum TaxID=3393320 RepID=UPI00237B847A|nr:S1C family serine protease [Mesorhizobium shangrilense]
MSALDLSAFSDAVADIAEKAAAATASLARGHHTASAFHWRDGLFVTAEEAVEDDETLDLILASGAQVKAELAGRDPSTGVALIRTTGSDGIPTFEMAGPPRVGSLAIAVGQAWDARLASLGTVGLVGPAWRSMRGGEIARRINLSVTAGGRFEGGPVLDARGALLGMLLFGPRRRVLVMPHENIANAVAALDSKGHVARGYLGASLHPMRGAGMQGAMVMSLDDDGPAKAAGIQLGDIIVAWDGEEVSGPRELLRRLGPPSAGRTVTLGIVRGGEPRDVTVAVGEKPLA